MKKCYLLFALSFCAFGLKAQFSVNWMNQFQTTTSANYSNEGRKVVTDANSNVFVLGDYSSDNDSAGHYVGTNQYSVRIYKYDFHGGLVGWAFIPVTGLVNNGYSNKSGFGLELDAAGNVFVGYSVINAQGNFDVILAKYSNSLVRSWIQTYSTNMDDVGFDMKVSGGLVIAGVKSSGGGNVTYSLIKANDMNAILIYSFATNVDVVNAIQFASSKGYYATGYTLVSGVKSAMTASISNVGALKWKTLYNHQSVTGDDYNVGILVGNDGYIYTIGTTYTNAANGTDGLIIKYNGSGLIARNLFMHKSTADKGGSIAIGPAGYLFAVCSDANSVSAYKIQISTTTLQVSLTGTYYPIPINGFTAITDVSVSDMKVAASNNVFVCGSVTGTSAGGPFASLFVSKFGLVGFAFRLIDYQPFGADNGENYNAVNLVLDGYKNDILVLANAWGAYSNHSSEFVSIQDLDGGVSLRNGFDPGTSSNPVTEIILYPNPASENINVTANEQIHSIEISDLTGKIVRLLKVDAIKANVPISDLNRGLYICKITVASGAITMKRLTVN